MSVYGVASVQEGANGGAYIDIQASADGRADFPNSRFIDRGPETATTPSDPDQRTKSISDNTNEDSLADRTIYLGSSTTLSGIVSVNTIGQSLGTGYGDSTIESEIAFYKVP